MMEFKKRRGLFSENATTAELGTAWYEGFSDHNKDKLKQHKSRAKDISRHGALSKGLIVVFQLLE
jgi:hypothetical protein